MQQLRRAPVLAAGLLATLLLPHAAAAHLRTGTVAVDYRASVSSSDTAYSARVLESDRALDLAVRPGHSVVVIGYLGEPFLRFHGAGVAVNAASPTSAASGLLKRGELVAGPQPSWRRLRGRSVVWHDARVQGLPTGVREGVWRVPLIVDGRRSSLAGVLVRLPRPAVWPWVLVALAFVATTAAIAWRRPAELERVAIALGSVAASASVVTALGFAFDTYASPGTWIAGGDEIAFAAAGVGVLLRGPARARAACACGLGLLALAVGASKGPVFAHSLVLSALPGTAARAAVALAVAAGAAAAVLGGLVYVPRALGSPQKPGS